jgi:hypothetical protein
MRRLALSLGAAAVLASAAFAPTLGHAAVGAGAAALQGAAQSALVEDVAYVCRWRPWGRTCFWRPGPYAAYGFYVGPRRHWWGPRRHWWGWHGWRRW